MTVVLTRNQLLSLSLQGLSAAQIRAFIAGAECVGKRKIRRRQDLLSKPLEDLPEYRLWQSLEKQGYWFLTFWDEEYPPLLREIYDPPMVLYGSGDLALLSRFSIAIVGTRNPSAYGERSAIQFAQELSQRGAVVISGLAYGIDSMAHRAVVNAEEKTVAVLGSGIDRIYPKAHWELSEKIQQSGCLLSEYPPGARALPYHFIERNRILSGLSRGILVVEAQQKSGTMITVQYALEQGKDVFCIPGNINQPRSFGTNQLIQKGACLVQTPEDLMQSYSDWPLKGNEKTVSSAPVDLTPTEEGLYDRLRQGAQSPNELLQSLSISTADLWVSLTSLEMKGKVIRRRDGYFIRKE